ncbi:UmuC domain [Trinorchestia longiramus]|nr:UmuC domain [Trinorchestia longiramus]
MTIFVSMMDPTKKVEDTSSSSQALHEQDSKDGDTASVDAKAPSISVEHLSNLSLNTHKAGMQGLDAVKINEIIRKASEGSRYFQHKQQAQQRLDAKIQDMLHVASGLSPEQLEKATKKMETVARQYEEERDLSRTIVHVDMDMFYAAVEMRDQPHLRSLPMAVGSSSMLSTSNYVARQFGVRAGMPGFIGRQLCPELVLVSPNFSKYKAVSKVVQEVFVLYDPNYAMMSLDEAYLDITEYMENNADGYPTRGDGENETLAEAIVREMRLKIQEVTKLTASAGIAANARLAKVCSDLNKPDGQYYLPPVEGVIMDFINGLPIRKISGIGNVMEQQLKALGISLCGELRLNYGKLRLLFSESSWHYFVRISLGLGETDLANYTGGEQKSISTETTFIGTSCRQKLLQIVSDLSAELHDDMTKKRLIGKLVTLKTKTVDFVLKTRSIPLGDPTNDPLVISHVARKLLIQEIEKCSECPAFRLLGVRMSNLSESNDGKEKQVTISKMFQKLTENTISNKDDRVNESHVQKVEIFTDSPENVKESHTSKDMVSTSLQGSPFKKRTLLSSQSSEKPNYICPVCGNVVQTKFLSTFNKHIDSCLESSTETLSGVGSSSVSRQLNVISHVDDMSRNNCDYRSSTVIDDDEALASEVCTNLSSCSNASKKSGVRSSRVVMSSFFASRSRASSNKELEQQSSSSSEPIPADVDGNCSIDVSNERYDELICPVCNCATFSSNESLNKHLDSCLTAGVGAAHSESSSLCDVEFLPDSSTSKPCQKTNVNAMAACFHQQDDHKILAASSCKTELPVKTMRCDSSSSKYADYSLSVKSSSSNLKRKMKSNIPTNNKRRSAYADVPITRFFS